jgi:hypothetical protein
MFFVRFLLQRGDVVKRYLAVCFGLLCVLALPFAARAATPSLVGASCTEFGVTKLDTNNMNIVACLYQTDPGNPPVTTTPKVWKSTTLAPPSYCKSNEIVIYDASTGNPGLRCASWKVSGQTKVVPWDTAGQVYCLQGYFPLSCTAYSVPSGDNSCDTYIGPDGSCNTGGCTATRDAPPTGNDTGYLLRVTCAQLN